MEEKPNLSTPPLPANPEVLTETFFVVGRVIPEGEIVAVLSWAEIEAQHKSALAPLPSEPE